MIATAINGVVQVEWRPAGRAVVIQANAAEVPSSEIAAHQSRIDRNLRVAVGVRRIQSIHDRCARGIEPEKIHTVNADRNKRAANVRIVAEQRSVRDAAA